MLGLIETLCGSVVVWMVFMWASMIFEDHWVFMALNKVLGAKA